MDYRKNLRTIPLQIPISVPIQPSTAFSYNFVILTSNIHDCSTEKKTNLFLKFSRVTVSNVKPCERIMPLINFAGIKLKGLPLS